jgi:hypothetical protein
MAHFSAQVAGRAVDMDCGGSIMRLASFSTASLFAVAAASGCAGANWTVADSHPVAAIAVAPAEVHGLASPKVAAHQRLALINELRARGYAIVEDKGQAQPGVARVALRFDGAGVSDKQMHGPDDVRHGIVNDLSYYFVAYKVRLDVVESDGRVVAQGAAEANQDPSAVMKKLTEKLVSDMPPWRGATVATR